MTEGSYPAVDEWILFDAADTLIYPEPDVAKAYCQAAASFGLKRDRQSVSVRFGPAIKKHFSDEISSEEIDRSCWKSVVFEVLETTDSGLFDHLWHHFALPSSWRLFDDVIKTLHGLRDRGCRIGVASNFDARLLPILESLLPSGLVEHIFISSQLGYRKPSSKFFRCIESRLEIDHATLVGDNLIADVHGAKDSGWKAVHLDRDDTTSAADDELRTTTLTKLLELWR